MSWYRESKPLSTSEGLAAKQLKAANWWAKRWISALESLLDAGRLRRGRRYARSGQVLELELGPGEARALVQGSRSTPYEVRIGMELLADAQWRRVEELLAQRALFTAQLLAGDVPTEIEAVFTEAGVTLLPATAGDLTISCSCPDWADVCKHAAAVAYLLGESFDQDPFGLFLLRGRPREQLLAGLLPAANAGGPSAAQLKVQVPSPLPLSDELDRFWQGGELPVVLEPPAPALQAHLLKRLGTFAGESLHTLLAAQYRQMSGDALGFWQDEEAEHEHDAE